MLSSKISKALEVLYKLIKNTNIHRVLSWSISLVIQWVDIIPSEDIDMLTDNVWAKELDKVLHSFVVKPLQYSSTEKYQSYFGIYKINDIQVEIMWEMQHRLKNNLRSKIKKQHKVYVINYNNMNLPVLSLRQELQAYENMGRSDKVKKIKEKLAQQ